MQTLQKTEPAIRLFDETFDKTYQGHFHLSLQVSKDNLSGCVLDTARKKYIALESYNLNVIYNYSMLSDVLEELLKKSAMFSVFSGKAGINAAIVNPKSTLVPVPLYEEESKDLYLQFNSTLDEGEKTAEDKLTAMDAVNLYALPVVLENTLKKFSPAVHIRHYSSPLLNILLSKYKNQVAKSVFVHVQLSHFEVIVLQGKNLIFYNSFRYQTSEDFIYYLLFVYEQLKLNPEKDALTLLGEVDKTSAIHDLLYKYIREIRFTGRPEDFEYSYKFNELPAQYFYNLFSQYLCV